MYKAPIPAFHCFVCLGISIFPTLAFFSTAPHRLWRNTELRRLQMLTHIRGTQAVLQVASYRRWHEVWHCSCCLFLLLCFPLPSSRGSKKGPSIWISAIRAGARSSCRGTRKPFLQGLGQTTPLCSSPVVCDNDIIMPINETGNAMKQKCHRKCL